MWQKEVTRRRLRRGKPALRHPQPARPLQGRAQLKLDELITRTYTLDQINQGYQDMLDGVNIRGVITFE